MSGYSDHKALNFCFQLMDYENKPLKMIEYIDSRTPYTIILRHFVKMAGADKTKLLTTIINKSNGYYWSETSSQADEACFSELLTAMIQCYTAAYLKAVLLKNQQAVSYYRMSNNFMEYMKKELLDEAKQP
jgi:hypothetical protein